MYYAYWLLDLPTTVTYVDFTCRDHMHIVFPGWRKRYGEWAGWKVSGR